MDITQIKNWQKKLALSGILTKKAKLFQPVFIMITKKTVYGKAGMATANYPIPLCMLMMLLLAKNPGMKAENYGKKFHRWTVG